MTGLHIAMVSEHASPLAAVGEADAGGQNVYVAALAHELARRRHRVTVFTRRDEPTLPVRVEMRPGVTVVHLDAGPARHIDKDLLFPHMPAFADVLTAALTADRPDVVHAHFWMSGWAALRSCDVLDLPLVQSFHALGTVKRRHQGADDPSPRERAAVETELATRADRVVATCSEEAHELRSLGTPSTNLARVPCGYDDELFTAFGPAELGPRTRPHRIAAVSRLVPRKGLAAVIAAIADHRTVELVIAGGPPFDRLVHDADHQRLVAAAEAAGVADRVRFTGGLAQRDVARLLRSADVFVAAPWYEPFGIAPVEAMACGTPVIGTAVGGLLDTIVDGRTGVLVPPRDLASLSAAIGLLVGDHRLRRSLGAAGARRAPRSYGWRTVGAAVERLYRDVMTPHASASVPG